MAQAHKFRKGKSLFSTTLSVGISTGTGETIALSSTVGLPTDTEITLTFDRVDADGTATPAKVERITGLIVGSIHAQLIILLNKLTQLEQLSNTFGMRMI